jgi:ferredoxin-type protein NapH
MSEKITTGHMVFPSTTRQKIRRAILLITFLLFPVVFKYLSPYVIIAGSAEGIVVGSLIYFAFLFVFSLFFGRAVCGWACPVAGMQEWACTVNDKRVKGGKLDWIKYFIWVPWIAIIILMAVMAGGYSSVQPTYFIDNGVSLTSIYDYYIYFIVLAIIIILSFTVGRRAFCHYVCWMSPFMIIGTKIKNLLRLPGLRLQSDSDKCQNCKTCDKNCPMSLDVSGMVQNNKMDNAECILCGTCIDSCPNSIIKYSWLRNK